ncbi:hypothetical protein ASE98_19235 [Pseudomonas sp. Leaf48]|uniref:DUF6124 family protein n=1 Tax=Pseudomonas sp. Leaf48 TaxID=1736221 RepID=UPI0007292F37|nr:DUF6124 family protein [Pseudomonas sp. Leaf48]KQN53697.1 hypothetical protein ASE98_19235 [Pseudomonas sp. Leaf48]
MIRSTPHPPETEGVSTPITPPRINPMFLVAPNINTETLLAHACESLASASVMASDFAGFLEGSQRSTMLGIQQVIMLGELAVNRALDNLDPQQ